ncbi:MAG: hypothetical protein R2743_14615 [Ilumatobacteraceae bacterium]|jgi:hypothetical protein
MSRISGGLSTADPDTGTPAESPEVRRVRIATGSFGRHFGARLQAERRATRRPLWVVATRSEGEFTVRDLRDAEAGLLPLDADTVARLGRLYDIPIRNALPPTERGLVIGAGSMSAGGVTTVFREGDASSMVDAYFHLVHLLRVVDEERTAVGFRQDDLDALVAHLQGGRQRHRPGTSTLEQVVTLAAAQGRVVVGSLLASVEALGIEPTVADHPDRHVHHRPDHPHEPGKGQHSLK